MGLWKQIQKNGEQRALIKQRDADLLASQKAFDDLSHERKRIQVITLDNLDSKEIIYKDRDVVKYEIREIVKNAPAEDCINAPLPDNLVCLLNGSCNSPAAGEDVPRRTVDERHARTADAR